MSRTNAQSFRRHAVAAATVAQALAMLTAGGCTDDRVTRHGPRPGGLVAGERMYRQGVLPSGEAMRASVHGSEDVPGTTFACVSCHMRSGLGYVEEGLTTPAVNGPKLRSPRHRNFPNMTEEERASLLPARFRTPPLRPGYTAASLAKALREGVDPAGRALDPVMPRYAIGDPDAAALFEYLGQLSTTYSPGVTDTNIALATVITEEVPPADQEAMFATLEASIRRHNNVLYNHGSLGALVSSRETDLSRRRRTLSRWLLRGPPETWRAQLEAHYRADPVFALVGGTSTLSWEPVHRFCESTRLPCILPVTDLPVISDSDVYTLYFSRGYHQEGEAAARFLDAGAVKEVVQVVDGSDDARALAAGFDGEWSRLGRPAARTLHVDPHTQAGVPALSTGPDATVLLWTGAGDHDLLASWLAGAARPSRVVMSATRLGPSLWSLPVAARAITYLTYPYRQPGEVKVTPKMGGVPVVVSKEYRRNDRRMASKAQTVADLLADRMAAMERNFYRDHLLDLFSMLPDQIFTDYENLAWHAGQVYGSEGCYVMQLSTGDPAQLTPVNGAARY